MAKIDEALIRERSYFIWLAEGCPEGRDVAHWLQAKAELEAAAEGRQGARKTTARKTTARKTATRKTSKAGTRGRRT